MAIPETKYNRSKKVFSDTLIALSCGRLWPRLLQSLAQSQTGSPGTLVDGGTNNKRSKLAKFRGWSPMDLSVKWHFSAYNFDMK
jgi:hypothetical protein